MKKNFMAIASLLIAAMLLVVSCAPEANVEGKVENGLVNASFSVAYGKDVVVTINPGVKIDYTYSLTPEWTLENGVEPFGIKSNQSLESNKGIGESFSKTNLGLVTPGLWKIEVEGKLSGTNTVVMKGSTKAHFRNANSGNTVSEITSATVYVAPVTNTPNGNLHISIQMEDLGDSNANKIKYAIDGIEKGTISGQIDQSTNVGTYVADAVVSSGYHYITFTVDGYAGGVTKSFLMLPGSAAEGGHDVTITGSVVPSKFATTGASINVISIPEKNITVGSKTFDGNGNYVPVVVTALDVPVSIGTYTKPTVPEGTTLTNPTYTWYVNGEKDTSTSYNISSGTMTIPNVPGDYTITCIISVTYTDADGNEYTIYGHEKQAAVVRLEKEVATSTPSQGK